MIDAFLNHKPFLDWLSYCFHVVILFLHLSLLFCIFWYAFLLSLILVTYHMEPDSHFVEIL